MAAEIPSISPDVLIIVSWKKKTVIIMAMIPELVMIHFFAGPL